MAQNSTNTAYINQNDANSVYTLSSARPEKYDVLVLDANSRKALATIRSLGKRGLRVAALATYNDLPVPAFSSRWCHKKIVCPADEGTEEYLAYLEALLSSLNVDVLIPSSDGTVALVRQHREKLERHVRIALAKEEALTIAVSKELTLAVAQKLGLGVPRSMTLTARNEVEKALDEIGLPAVIKPIESWISGEHVSYRVASQLVTTPNEARSAVEELTRFGNAVLFQQFLPGKRDSLYLFYAQGKLYARFAYWCKRTDPPLGGTWSLAQSMVCPSDIGEQAERLIREIDLEGYSHIEFRRDSSGKPYLMEINSRLAAGLGLAVEAGVDFPYLLYQWASGKQIDTVQNYRVGKWMRYLWGDIAGTLASIQQRGRPGMPSPLQAVLAFFFSFFVPMKYDYLDWKDPWPVWTALIGRGRGGVKRLSNVFAKKPVVSITATDLRIQPGKEAETPHV